MNKDNVIKTSFFDQKNYISTEEEKSLCYVRPENEFWLKLKDKKQTINEIFCYLNDDVLYEGYLYKKSQKTKQNKNHYYRLYKDRLERYETPIKEEQDKVLILRGIKCELLNIQDDEDFKDTDDKFLIIFTLNKNFIILYCQHEQHFQEWNKVLRQTCILSYFGKYYKNQKVIGRGTFAKVVLSKNLQNNQEYAVKTFDKKNLMSDQTSNKARIGLINEIHLMMMLDNPNIIKLYEVYEGEYHIYLVMELLNGGELFDRIMNKGHYEEKDAAILITKLLKALVYLHSMNIMHRDIKPENLILKDENGFDLKLADFGLAEFVNQKNHLFKRCGTPGYVAPEILDDQPYDTKVDVFSAGVILYILLTGCSPFYGETYNEILIKNKKCQVNYELEDLKQKASELAIDLLKKMLEKEPQQRITAKQCLQHQWIIQNCNIQDHDTNPQSPYKNKRQSIQDNMKNLKIDTKVEIKNTIKSNLTQFKQMNNNLSVQTNRPNNLVISVPVKYNNSQNQEENDDSPSCSPYIKQIDKFKSKEIQKQEENKKPFTINPKKVEN